MLRRGIGRETERKRQSTVPQKYYRIRKALKDISLLI
jgi:hypothetical protein